MLAEHNRKLLQGEIARLHGHNIQIDESIDEELRKEVGDFLNNGVRVLKQGMQDVTRVLQIKFGFLFQKVNAFENGLADLEKTDRLLAAYLRETRKWSERLVKCRTALEHEGWMLPKIRYTEASGAIHAEEPEIAGQPVSEFVKVMMNRLCCFVEEVTAHCLQARMPTGISVTELPLPERDPEVPERFRLTLTNGGLPVWNIAYDQLAFDEI